MSAKFVPLGNAKLRRPPGQSKVFEFETPDLWIQLRFIKTLKLFHIAPIEEYGELALDYHGCKFCSTKQERLRIEYVFRRMIGLDDRYLMDLDNYQNRCELYQEEKYAIY